MKVCFQRTHWCKPANVRSFISYNRPFVSSTNTLSHGIILSYFIRSILFSLLGICCGLCMSVNSDWFKQPNVCGEPISQYLLLQVKARRMWKPHTAPVNQQLPLLCCALTIADFLTERDWYALYCTHPFGGSCLSIKTIGFKGLLWDLWSSETHLLWSETNQGFNLRKKSDYYIHEIMSILKLLAPLLPISIMQKLFEAEPHFLAH